jgi:hypothetical protein
VIVGGTGILPFLDLFDLTLKKAITLIKKEKAADSPHNIDPYDIGYANILPNIQLKVYASFTSAEEFNNYQWLVDLHQICADNRLSLFELVLKLPDDVNLGSSVGRYHGRFDEQFFAEHVKQRDVSKVHVCGPSKMNNELSKLLKDMQYNNFVVL